MLERELKRILRKKKVRDVNEKEFPLGKMGREHQGKTGNH